MMDKEDKELPSNSRANRVAPMRPEVGLVKADKKKVRRVIAAGGVVRGKKTLARSIASGLAGETMRNLGSYILGDVIIPTTKSLIEDIIKNALDQILYPGESRRSQSRNTDSKVSYGKYFKSEDNRRDGRPHSGGRAGNFDLDNIFFKRMPDASDVLAAMCDQLDEYDEVTVADYFDMAGVEGATWTHNKWGWKDLGRAYCTHTRNGYAIVLPSPVELD
jgi:hypothetical protein